MQWLLGFGKPKTLIVVSVLVESSGSVYVELYWSQYVWKIN